MFSWICPHCKKAILPASVKGVDKAWSTATLVGIGFVIQGSYDGKGDIVTDEGLTVDVNKRINVLNRKLYHSRCYDLEGGPGFKRSVSSGDSFTFGKIDPQEFTGLPGDEDNAVEG